MTKTLKANQKGSDSPLCSDMAYQYLIDLITEKKVEPGEKIIEENIAAQLAISRGPVREAINRLVQDGLLTSIPHKGCFVATFNSQDLKEIFEIRKRLECLALELAFEQLDMNEIIEYRRIFEEYHRLDYPGTVEDYFAADWTFHRMIINSSQSKHLSGIIKNIHAKVQMYLMRFKHDIKSIREGLEEHLGIIEAILADKKEKAVSLLAQHIDNSYKKTLIKEGFAVGKRKILEIKMRPAVAAKITN